MDFFVVKRSEIAQELKPKQQCEQPYALSNAPRKEQLSTQEKMWEEGMWKCMAKKEIQQKEREKGKKKKVQ